MIEQISYGPNAYRVSAAYCVLGHEEARQLERLLAHLTAIIHDVATASLEATEEALAQRLRDEYGFDPYTAGPTEKTALYARLTEECVTLLRALGAARSADSVRPLTTGAIFPLDAPARPLAPPGHR